MSRCSMTMAPTGYQRRNGGPVLLLCLSRLPPDILIKRFTPPPQMVLPRPPPLMVPRVVGTEHKGQPGATSSQMFFEKASSSHRARPGGGIEDVLARLLQLLHGIHQHLLHLGWVHAHRVEHLYW